jgi:transcription elongation factor Elf1
MRKLKKKNLICEKCGKPSFGKRCHDCYMKFLNEGPARKSHFKVGHKKLFFNHSDPVWRAKIKNTKAKNPWNPTDEQRMKMHLAQKGEKSWNWKGGKTEESFLRFKDFRWRKVAQEVRLRDNFTCQGCGTSPAVDVHHIVPWRVSKDDSMTNLVLLCRSCHMKIERLLSKKYPHVKIS